MTAVNVVALATLMTLPLPTAVAQAPLDDARGGPELGQSAPDTATAARALVPLLNNVKQRLRPRTGVVMPGNPQPSPFTGTVTTLLSFGIGKREVPVDPKVVEAIDRLLAWNVEGKDQTAEAVLFDHWMTQLTVKAATVGLLNCDSACVVQRFGEPDQAFGRSIKEREETRDQLLLDALTAAVEEVA